MVDITYVDHVKSGLSLLPSQWDDKPNIRGALESFLTPLNTTEQQALDVRDGFNVRTAVGVQLEIIGAYFQIERQGRTDQELRLSILTSIASSNGSGTPEQVMETYKTLTDAESIQYWEHYPLAVTMVAYGGDEIIPNIINNMVETLPAGVEFASLMVDPYQRAWIGNDSIQTTANIITGDGDNLVDNFGNQFVVEAFFEEVDDGLKRSSFVDESVRDPSEIGWGKAYGQDYGGAPTGSSQFADSSILGNSLVTSGGNGFLLWAEQAELDPVSGTTNKAVPPLQLQNSGIKRRQPLARQFFNWLISNIDDWFKNIHDRTPVGAIKIIADDAGITAADLNSRYRKIDGTNTTWVQIADVESDFSPALTKATNAFQRTA